VRRRHPSTPGWQPGAGGLILHRIVAHPIDPERMWMGISAVGIFHTPDGGSTWEARNHSVRAVGSPDEFPETGQFVHKFALHPDRPEVLYQHNHSGAYRSDDDGLEWRDINAGLPSTFGFPIAVHPQDPRPSGRCPQRRRRGSVHARRSSCRVDGACVRMVRSSVVLIGIVLLQGVGSAVRAGTHRLCGGADSPLNEVQSG
jgi:hypothetical protein